MPACHHRRAAPRPRAHGWLLTDARLDRHGIAAARRIPPGSILLVRSDALPANERRRLIRALRRIAGARRCRLLVAGDRPEAVLRMGADGIHLRRRSARRAAQARRLGLIVSMPVHNRREADAAAKAGPHHGLISPLHATRSHVGAEPLSRRQWLALARMTRAHPVALGGMTMVRWRKLLLKSTAQPFRPGWAAIDAWETGNRKRRNQKRNWVPT